MNKNNNLLQNISKRGEKILMDNLVEKDEVQLVKLKGSFGEALVITDKRLYVLKWGFMAGNTIGGRCIVFGFDNITALEIKKGLMTGTFEVLTPATQNTQKSYWGSGDADAIKSDNVITFQRDAFSLFQDAVKTGRDLIQRSKNSSTSNTNSFKELEELAVLRDRGIINEEEFVAKKKQILGL